MTYLNLKGSSSPKILIKLNISASYKLEHSCTHRDLKYHGSDSEMCFYSKQLLSICLKLRTHLCDVQNKDEWKNMFSQVRAT